MSKASKDYQKIIKQIEGLKERCNDTEKAAVQEAMDIISDYEKVVTSLNRMIEQYERKNMARKMATGIYVCPNCGKRVTVNHSHCHRCGKKIDWKGAVK